MALSRPLLISLIVSLPCSLLLAAEQTVEFDDGASLKLLFFTPDNAIEPPPLAILIAGGSNNEFMAKAQFWFGKEFVDHGWAIAVPISPDGRQFSEDETSVIPEIVEILHESHSLQKSKPLIVGISSGGSEAMALAVLNPTYYKGVVAAPGRLKSDELSKSLQGLAIYLRIGERDHFRWNRMLTPMTEQLREAGAEVNSAIVTGARHVFRINWNSLETWLEGLK